MNVQVTVYIILNRRNQFDRSSSLWALEIRLSFYTGDRSSVRQTWSLLLSGGPRWHACLVKRLTSATRRLVKAITVSQLCETAEKIAVNRTCRKRRRGRKRERERENISWKIFNVSFVFLSSLSRRISSISRRNPSKLKLGPNYQSMFDLSIIPVSTRNITPTVPTSIAISTVQISKKPVSYRRMIHRRDSPCSPRRWTRQSGSLPRVRRTPCTVDSSATQKIMFFPESVPLNSNKGKKREKKFEIEMEGLAILRTITGFRYGKWRNDEGKTKSMSPLA